MAIRNFVLGPTGVELFAYNRDVEIQLRRREWGFLIVAVTFLGPTIH